MGHIVLIGNHLVKYSATAGVPEDILKFFTSDTWKDFEKLTLAEANQRNNRPLGGHRPTVPAPDSYQHPNTGMDTNVDQFARFLCHQIAGDLPEKFGEEEDEDFEMGESQYESFFFLLFFSSGY